MPTLLALALTAAVAIQAPPADQGDAKYFFLLGRYLEGAGKVDEAVSAFKKAIEAGREAREIGLAEKLSAAAATSPLTGFFSR